MPGRSYNAPNAYRYGFNGKENDNDVAGSNSYEDYGMRIYYIKLGRFISVDPITKKYPMLTPFQFASNSPISGKDLDGLEYYYSADGTLQWTFGTSTEVMVVNDAFVQANQKKDVSIKDLRANSTSAGMTNDELNTRAFMSTLKQAENGGHDPLPYNAWNGFTKGKVNKFTEKTYEEAPTDYDDHPGKRSGGSAAGAYQIMSASWNDQYQGADAYGVTDFGPKNQDKFIFLTIKHKLKALDVVASGNIEEAIKKTATEWRALPGTKTQSSITVEEVKKMFKANVAKELANKSDIATPKGQLTKYEKKKK